MRELTSFALAQASTTKSFAIEDLLSPEGVVFQLVFAIAILVGGWVIAIFFSSRNEN